MIGEVEWVTVSAVHSGGGSWTVKTLWQLTQVEEICPPYEPPAPIYCEEGGGPAQRIILSSTAVAVSSQPNPDGRGYHSASLRVSPNPT